MGKYAITVKITHANINALDHQSRTALGRALAVVLMICGRARIKPEDRMKLELNIPKDKNYPTDAVQCDDCGGLGWCFEAGDCSTCFGKGWLPKGHPKGRKCARDECDNRLKPNHVAMYCSNECAYADA